MEPEARHVELGRSENHLSWSNTLEDVWQREHNFTKKTSAVDNNRREDTARPYVRSVNSNPVGHVSTISV